MNMGIKNALSLVGGYLFRWEGFPTEPRLIKVGNPGRDSPVLLTCNFNITVKRVLKAINDLDCYLLVAPSNGINVWCGACGDDFTTDSAISIIKTSGINDLVDHHTLILPQLSASGLDPVEIKKETGWTVKFGPVYAKYIPDYIKDNYTKTDEMKRVTFPIPKRIEMANMYFFIMWLITTVIFGIFSIFSGFNWQLYLELVVVIAAVLYGSLIILPSIKTKTGLVPALIFEGIIIILILLFYFFVYKSTISLILSIVLSLIAAMLMIEDFHGLTPIFKSELGEKTWKKGKDQMTFLGSKYKLQPYGEIKLDREKCIGCKVCVEVCPRTLYTFNETDKKVDLHNPEDCINCNACVKRCLGHCLEIVLEQ